MCSIKTYSSGQLFWFFAWVHRALLRGHRYCVFASTEQSRTIDLYYSTGVRVVLSVWDSSIAYVSTLQVQYVRADEGIFCFVVYHESARTKTT